jgi:hypothetical protein
MNNSKKIINLLFLHVVILNKLTIIQADVISCYIGSNKLGILLIQNCTSLITVKGPFSNCAVSYYNII